MKVVYFEIFHLEKSQTKTKESRSKVKRKASTHFLTMENKILNHSDINFFI